jgi:hypothetical protein
MLVKHAPAWLRQGRPSLPQSLSLLLLFCTPLYKPCMAAPRLYSRLVRLFCIPDCKALTKAQSSSRLALEERAAGPPGTALRLQL